MIDLCKIRHKSVNMVYGINAKRLIVTDSGKYVFKANCGFVEKKEVPTSFGEVFYSKVCKRLNCNCVNAVFAQMFIDKNLSHGTLIDYFWEKDTLETISFGDIMQKSDLLDLSFGDDVVIDDVIDLSSFFAKNMGLKFDAKNAKKCLTKMAVLDYFFAQADRHFDNIEFLISKKEMKLAPIFDNGFCFNLWREKENGDIVSRSEYIERGYPQFLRMANTDSADDKTKDLAKQIYVTAKKSPEIRELVSNIYNLDMDEILKDVYIESDKQIDIDYVENCRAIFEYRKQLLKNFARRMDAVEHTQMMKDIKSMKTKNIPHTINNNACAQERFI